MNYSNIVFLRVVIIALALSTPFPAFSAPTCTVPDQAIPSHPKLPATVKALAAKEPIKIVTVGLADAAVSRVDRSLGMASYLADILRAKFPGQVVKVVDKRLMGRQAEAIERQIDKGDAIAAVLKTFDSEVIPEHPTLVLWSAGSYAAVNGSDSRQLALLVSRVLDFLKASHIDVILVDMQYSPASAMMIDFKPYLEALEFAAYGADIPLFGRFATLQAWSDEGVFDLDGMNQKEDHDMPTEVDTCLGVGLAQIIERAHDDYLADRSAK